MDAREYPEVELSAAVIGAFYETYSLYSSSIAVCDSLGSDPSPSGTEEL